MTVLDTTRLRFLPLAEAEIGPKSGFCRVIRDHWWTFDPERGLVFWWSRGEKGIGSPQCNRDEAMSRTIHDKLWPQFQFRFIPIAFVPIRLEDYQ